MKINAVLFDADGVIQTTRPDFIPRLKALVGTRHQDADRFVGEIFAVEKPCLTGEADFAVELADLLNRWQVESSVDDVISGWHSIEPISPVTDLIRNLRLNGTLCCLATNQQQYRASFMKTTLRYESLFERQFYSHEMGVVKPDIRYFQYILSAISLPAAQTLFIDDNESNVEAARSLGINGLVFNAALFADPGAALSSALEGFDIQPQ